MQQKQVSYVTVNHTDDESLWTSRDVMETLNISPATYYRMVRRKELPSPIAVRQSIRRYRPADIIAWKKTKELTRG